MQQVQITGEESLRIGSAFITVLEEVANTGRLFSPGALTAKIGTRVHPVFYGVMEFDVRFSRSKIYGKRLETAQRLARLCLTGIRAHSWNPFLLFIALAETAQHLYLDHREMGIPTIAKACDFALHESLCTWVVSQIEGNDQGWLQRIEFYSTQDNEEIDNMENQEAANYSVEDHEDHVEVIGPDGFRKRLNKSDVGVVLRPDILGTTDDSRAVYDLGRKYVWSRASRSGLGYFGLLRASRLSRPEIGFPPSRWLPKYSWLSTRLLAAGKLPGIDKLTESRPQLNQRRIKMMYLVTRSPKEVIVRGDDFEVRLPADAVWVVQSDGDESRVRLGDMRDDHVIAFVLGIFPYDD